MKNIYTSFQEFLNENNSIQEETVQVFVDRFEIENSNSDFLKNNLKNPNFRLELVHDGNVKIKEYKHSIDNKCELNVFNFIKQMVKLNNHRYYPVSGWAFLKSTTFFEHFWIYDAVDDLFLDITPIDGELPYAYGGVVNFNINDDILNAKKYTEIDFLKGKAYHSLYKNNSLPIEQSRKDIFDFINNNEKYKDLSSFIKVNNITNIEELKKYVIKLENIRDNVRNNRDWDYYTNLINQIKHIDF